MMELLKNLEKKQDLAYAYIRIFLGIALAARGMMLILNPDSISELIREENLFVGHALIAISQLFGGIFIALGFFTRLASLCLTPIVLGAIIMVHWSEGLLAAGQSLELAVLVLFLLLVYTIYGSGPLSMHDRIFKKED